MSTKTDALYRKILQRKVVRFDDIARLADVVLGRQYGRSYINNIYVQNLIKAGLLERVRRGLYVALSPIDNRAAVDKLLIASKIRERYYLGFHTALEYHGCAYSHHNEVYICIKSRNRFDPFEFGQYRFTPVFVTDVETEVGEKKYKAHRIRISSKERTFIECLDRVEYAGGWEEALKSLENLGGLDFERIRTLAIQKRKQMTLRKTGFILELLEKSSLFYEHLPQHILESLESQIHGQPRYLVRNVPGPLNPRWRLYIPEEFEEKLRGV